MMNKVEKIVKAIDKELTPGKLAISLDDVDEFWNYKKKLPYEEIIGYRLYEFGDDFTDDFFKELGKRNMTVETGQTTTKKGTLKIFRGFKSKWEKMYVIAVRVK